MQELVNDGGMSAPAWAFFTSIVVMIGGVLVEAIRTRRKVDEARDVAAETVENTKHISNGFATEIRGEVAEVRRLITLVMDAQIEVRRDVGTLSRRLDAHIDRSGKEV
jgi:phosphosulfolactate synthase (CoM biosynthesis protein A)